MSSYASTAPPQTPTSSTFHVLSSPTSSGLPTPPPSIRKYSDDLRRHLTAGWQAAVAVKNEQQGDQPSAAQRRLDVDYGYDEDPFDVHARMIASTSAPPRADSRDVFGLNVATAVAPAKGGPVAAVRPAVPMARQASLGQLLVEAIPDVADVDIDMDLDDTGGAMHEDVTARFGSSVDPVRKGAEQRAHALPVRDPQDARALHARAQAHFRPSLLHYPSSSYASTASTVPSSAFSGQSRLSTPSTSQCDSESPAWSEDSFEAAKPEDYAAAYGLHAPRSTSASTFGPSFASAQRPDTPPPDCASRPDRSSLSSTTSASSTVSALSAASTLRQSQRPSLLRPPMRSRPYPEQASRDPSPVGDLAAYDGRTVSEDMILTAGLMCQRGRTARRAS